MADNASERIRQRLFDAELIPPRYRHFTTERGRGKQFCWTVEPDFLDPCPNCGGTGWLLYADHEQEGDCPECEGSGKDKRPGKGWYYSFVYKPVGKGARSGKAEQWEFDRSSVRRHRKRKDAKARAERLLSSADS